MQELEQTLDSREVAGMVKKNHGKLLRDIRTYIEHLTEAKIVSNDLTKSILMWLKKCLTFWNTIIKMNLWNTES